MSFSFKMTESNFLPKKWQNNTFSLTKWQNVIFYFRNGKWHFFLMKWRQSTFFSLKMYLSAVFFLRIVSYMYAPFLLRNRTQCISLHLICSILGQKWTQCAVFSLMNFKKWRGWKVIPRNPCFASWGLKIFIYICTYHDSIFYINFSTL